MSNLYSKIKAIRIEKKLSQQDLGKKIGTNQSNYARIEAGLTQLTIERIEQIAKVFEMTVSELMSYEGGEIGQSEVSDYVKYIKELEKKIEKLQDELEEKGGIEVEEFQENKKNSEKLLTEIKNLKATIKEKDERLKDKDMVIDALKMVIGSRVESNK